MGIGEGFYLRSTTVVESRGSPLFTANSKKPMARGITLEDAAQRLQDAGARLGKRYEEGTRGKGGIWFDRASDSQANWEEGINRAAAENLFEKGVQDAGPEAYNEGVKTKGVANWPRGMRVAGTKYIRKVRPYQTLWDDPLPTPPGPRQSAANLSRMQENIDRFVAKKREQ